MKMRRRRLIHPVAAAGLVAAACVPGPASSPPPTTVSTTAVSSSTGPVSSTTTTAVSSASSVGLSPEFVAAVFPIDGAEYAAGQAGFSVGFARAQFDFLAACAEQLGYREIADETRNLDLYYPTTDEVWRLPNRARLREQGFDVTGSGDVQDLWFSSMGNPPKNT